MPADWLFNVSCTFDAQGVCITFISRHNNGIVCDTLKTGFFREEAPLLFLLKKRKKYTAVYALSFLNCAKLHPSVCVTVKNYDELCLDFKPARVNQFDCNKNFTHYFILLFHVFLFLHYSCSIVCFSICPPWLLLEHQGSTFAWLVLNSCTFLFRHGFNIIWLEFWVNYHPPPSHIEMK